MIIWKTETRKLKDLKPHPKNPRKLSKHDAAHLQKSLEKFGLIDKPVITVDGLIIGGHQRIAILKKMKHKEVECYVPDQEMTDKDIEELNVRLNRNNGEWDFDILANEFDVGDLLSYGFTEVEFSLTQDEEKELDESIIDDLELLMKFKIEIANEYASSFEIQLAELLNKFPQAKMTKNL